MTTITDEFMRQMIGTAKSYSVVILKMTPKRNEAGADKIAWEHGRRNFELRSDGVLSIVLPPAVSRETACQGRTSLPTARNR